MKKLTLLCLLGLCHSGFAQTPNKYGLSVINTEAAYKKSIAENRNKELVDLEKFIPGIRLDVRYATTNNFSKQAVYDQARAFARLPVAAALKNVQAELSKSGLGLKIFDAYRPYRVTVKFFQLASDKNFVANPKNGSRHNRGCAVDLTLIDLKSGKELKMPTSYDSFEAAASPGFKNLPSEVIKNRDLLISVMQGHGFRVLDNEWWHFDFRDWKSYELLDIPFENL